MLTRLRGLALTAAAIVVLPAALQAWFWSSMFRTAGYFSQSDLYEEFLPQFLAPLMTWSSMEFAGMPVFADPQNAAWYPVQLLARALGSWSLYVAGAYVIAAVGAAAYAWQITRSRTAALLAGIAWPLSEAMADLTPHFAMLHGFAWFPLVLFGIEKIAETRDWRWAGATGVFAACFALAGHPQVAVYCGYVTAPYLVALWWQNGRDGALARLLGGAFVIGGLLAAIQLVPTLALSEWIARNQVGFGHFADGFTKRPSEFLAGIIPQFCHERRETPQYAGILTLLLACAAPGLPGRNWRTLFWTVVAVVCLLLGLGSQTPLAAVAYHLPVLDRFRVVARFLTLAIFAIVSLAAITAAAASEGRLRGRQIWRVLVPGLAALGALAFVRSRPDLFAMPCDRFGIDWIWPAGMTHVTSQAVLVVLSCACMLLAGRAGWKRAVMVAMPLLMAFDLLNAQSEPVTAGGLEPSILKPALTAPSVHAVRLRDELASTHQRLLPLEGSATDAVVPGMFARLWNVPSLGGYNPLLPARLNTLTRMNNNGSVGPNVLLADDLTLDLFATRFVLVRASELVRPPAAAPGATLASLPALDVLLGPSDCRPRGAMRLTLSAPEVEAAGIVVSGTMRCGDNVKAGDDMGAVTLSGADGQTRTVPLVAGGGHGADRIGISHLSDEAPAEIEKSRVTFAPLTTRTVTIETTPQRATLAVDRVAIVTADGHVLPLTLPSAAVTSPRWREWRRFTTSRDSDRGTDEAARDEIDYVVLENTHARPRAWFTGTVFDVPDEQAMETIRFGRRRDGTPLNLATSAFVDSGTPVQAGGGSGTVTVVTAGQGRFTLEATAASSGLALVSELHHPSWRATVDGAPVEVVRADYALIGVPIPAGHHRIELEFKPGSLTLGAGLSVAGGLATLACFIRPKRRRSNTVRTEGGA